MTGTVYIVQKNNNLNYKPAERFGRISTLYERDVFPDDADERTEAMTYIARSKLRNFDPEHDFVLLSGDPIAMSIVILVLGEHHDVIPVLKWYREEKAYMPIYLSPRDYNFKEDVNYDYNQ